MALDIDVDLPKSTPAFIEALSAYVRPPVIAPETPREEMIWDAAQTELLTYIKQAGLADQFDPTTGVHPMTENSLKRGFVPSTVKDISEKTTLRTWNTLEPNYTTTSEVKSTVPLLQRVKGFFLGVLHGLGIGP